MNALEKSLWIVNRLSAEDAPVSLSTLAKELGMSRSGVFKIMSTLSANNFVLQDPKTKHYRLGVSLLRLGFEFENQLGVWDVAEMIVKELVEKYEASSVSIGIMEGGRPFLAYRVVGKEYSYYKVKQGVSYPIHASAIGKCLAAYMNRENLLALLAKAPLKKHTENTITDADKLLEEYDAIRKNGYSVSYGEHFPLGTAVAAPIEIRNEVRLCLSAGGLLPEFDREKIDRFIPILQGSANRIAEKMKYKY